MYKAYVRGDPLENSEVISELASRLGDEISIILTDKAYMDIVDPSPFLYYRNPYIRFDNELELIKFHTENSNLRRLMTIDREIISANPFSELSYDYRVNSGTYLYEPKDEPLPILMGVHRRPEYLKFTLNSLLYSLQSKRQKLYIVLSDSDTETTEIIKNTIENSDIHVEAVVSNNNLFYGFVNFGAKFFGLNKKIILFDEDVIVPENLKYHIPFWTSQFNYRATTADLVALKVSKENYTVGTLQWLPKPVITIPENNRWYYSKIKIANPLPIGGMGMAIECNKHLKDFKEPEYGTSDSEFCKNSRNICIANVAVYHIGVNEKMDYPAYYKNKPMVNRNVNRYQEGINLITGETKTIDMQLDWAEHKKL